MTDTEIFERILRGIQAINRSVLPLTLENLSMVCNLPIQTVKSRIAKMVLHINETFPERSKEQAIEIHGTILLKYPKAAIGKALHQQ